MRVLKTTALLLVPILAVGILMWMEADEDPTDVTPMMQPDERSRVGTRADNEQAMKQLFDRTLEWILANASIRGFIINDAIEKAKHMRAVELVEIDDPYFYLNPPQDALFAAADPPIWGMYLLAHRDLEYLYVSSSRNFSQHYRIYIGDELPFRKKYFLYALEDETAYFTYASFLLQVEVVNPLLLAFEATRDRKYVDHARTILLHLVDRVDTDGRFTRYYADEKDPRYNGRIQALVMYELWSYLNYQADEYLEDALHGLASTFKHTTEGTINHRTSSNIDQVIANKVLGEERFSLTEIAQDIQDTLDTFEEDGNLSKVMRSSPKFPFYKPTYLSYDIMLLMRLSQFLYADEIYKKVFPIAFEKSVSTLNTGIYLARNLYTLYYAKKLHGHHDERFYRWVDEALDWQCDFRNVWEARAQLQIIAIYLAYSQLQSKILP